tara:strand:- start:321 stop:3044 length:2724 start_codon:yes stop_codon:yes gene_type:complete
MSLAYTLDVTELKNVKSLSQAIINSAVLDIGFFELQGLFRFYDVTGQCQQIFPTGEYIIRGGIFMNGMYIYIGSYKAYIKDLFGVGSHGYAWDGFVMVMRGYSINEDDGFNIFSEGGVPDPTNFGFLPMRMPIEVNCGPVGSAAAIAADSSVGLHGIDIYKAIDDVQVDGLDRAIKIITCGFQRIDATVEGVPTGSDYVGNLYLAELLSFENVQNLTPQGSNYVQYRSDLPFRVMQNTWKATQAGHADKTNVIARFGFLRDLDQGIGGDEAMAPLPYTFDEWRDGQLPDGTNPGGGSTNLTDRRAITYNYFPRRFLDVSCFSQTAISGTEDAGSCFFIAGDMALDTNNDGTIDDTCPVAIGGVFEWPGAWVRMLGGDSPYSYLPPFLICHAAIKTSLAIAPSWFREGAAPTYTFSGAVAALVSPPYERIAIDGLTNPLITFAVNDVSHSGTDYGHIYVTSRSPVSSIAEFYPYATQGGAFTTASGISMPTKWYNKAIQERTFSISEEDISKVGTTNTETGVFTPTADSVFDEDSEEYVGYRSNYQRYGLTTDPDASGVGILQGTPSRNGYGFLGFKTGVGPIAVMFDSGAPTQTINLVSGNNEETGIALAEGANINANTLISPNSTTRRIVNAGWDNDRDQWLFISSDSGGSGVISVAANFTTASNNLGFLDQTSNFANNSLLPLPTTANAGLYIPYLMSNALDGFICFGEWDDDSNSRFGIKPILGASEVASNTCGGVTISYTRYASTSYFYRISGTTGRTARVWVDYVLFDGADSVIAKKLKEFGMKVNIENVEWFKRKIIRSGDLNIKSEEIEMWMREQQSEYKEMLKEKERMGRIRKKKSQVSAFSDGIDEQINPDFMDDEVKDFLGSYTPETRPPTPEEKRQKKKRQGGYEESTDSYYDDAF